MDLSRIMGRTSMTPSSKRSQKSLGLSRRRGMTLRSVDQKNSIAPCLGNENQDPLSALFQCERGTLKKLLPVSRVTRLSESIGIVDAFLSVKECHSIVAELEFSAWQPSLTYRQRSGGSYHNVLSPFRVSETAHQQWFSEELTVLVKIIEDRMQSLMAVNLGRLEPWQATRYSPGGRFDYHLDAGYWDAHHAGDRVSTFVLYLDTPSQGGSTHFRALDISVKAKAGRLLVWNNLFANGECDYRMIHCSTPVFKGTKTTLVTWLRQKTYRDATTGAR